MKNEQKWIDAKILVGLSSTIQRITIIDKQKEKSLYNIIDKQKGKSSWKPDGFKNQQNLKGANSLLLESLVL